MAKRAKRAERRPRLNPKRNIVPDQLDLRDRPYLPTLLAPPDVEMAPGLKLPVLDQERTSACTGFALASVVNFLLRRHRGPRDARGCRPSCSIRWRAAMTTSQFPKAHAETQTADSGSSLRGAMKGWYKHGVAGALCGATSRCRRPQRDARKPTGGWTPRCGRSGLTTGSTHARLPTCMWLCARSACSTRACCATAGWLEGNRTERRQELSDDSTRRDGRRQRRRARFHHPRLHRSTASSSRTPGARTWGTRRARGPDLRGLDRERHGLLGGAARRGNGAAYGDCEVAVTLRMEHGKVQHRGGPLCFATARCRLSSSIWRTTGELFEERDISHTACRRRGAGRISTSTRPESAGASGKNEPADVAVYAHGGLTDEDTAAKTAAELDSRSSTRRRSFRSSSCGRQTSGRHCRNRLEDLVDGTRHEPNGWPSSIS